jgi:hypothetical protein
MIDVLRADPFLICSILPGGLNVEGATESWDFGEGKETKISN